MSRSYKKHPVCKDGNRSKKASKKLANRRVRNTILSGGKYMQYKNCYERWDVCDYRFYQEKEVGMDEEELKRWKKWYYRK